METTNNFYSTGALSHAAGMAGIHNQVSRPATDIWRMCIFIHPVLPVIFDKQGPAVTHAMAM